MDKYHFPKGEFHKHLKCFQLFNLKMHKKNYVYLYYKIYIKLSLQNIEEKHDELVNLILGTSISRGIFHNMSYLYNFIVYIYNCKLYIIAYIV